MRKNIEDYQGCQYRIIAENRDISVGRRFKPDLGHRHYAGSMRVAGLSCRSLMLMFFGDIEKAHRTDGGISYP